MNLLHGDCLEVLQSLPDGSVDAVVTDPPYGLSFMGKKWDYDVPSEAIWRECLRVLKPGGHLLAFAGTRTQHRMAVRIEDAGFEIRDMIAWVYGSGFPKSHNLKDEWAGWGTALKPALEPITVARKPLAGTVAANVQAHGTGALNIDGCRVSFAGDADEAESKTKNQHAKFGSGPMTNQVFGKYTKDRDDYNPPGRWPANLIHDGSKEVVGLFPVQKSPGTYTRNVIGHSSPAPMNRLSQIDDQRTVAEGYGDQGSAARFFYCAKASKRDRGEGNAHPTVKPTDLMRYLCRLITPPGGVVLDPFMGSGSTGKACALEGFQFIGIEREAEYVEIARARIAAVTERQQEALFA